MSAATRPNTGQPSVSVLLPAWNEEDTLSRCLDSLMALHWPDLEIIVCAGGTDATGGIAASYGHANPDTITVLTQHAGEGKQVALRRCYQESRGEVIYLTDADCVVPAETFRELVNAVGPMGVDAATGPTNPLPEQRKSAWVRHQWATVRAVDRGRGKESSGLLGRNCAVRREAIEAASAFREPVKTGTDFHLAKKLLAADRTIHYLPQSVETRYHEGFLAYTRQQSRWMRNILIHGRQFETQSEGAQVARSIALGAALLTWPLTWPWTKLPGIMLWMIPIGWMTRVRIKQEALLEAEFQLDPLPDRVPRAVLFSLADLVVWVRPGLDMLVPSRRSRW